MKLFGAVLVLGSSLVLASNPFDTASNSVDANRPQSSDPLNVDLGYSLYEGYADSSSSLNIFKGIRYTAPPTGSLRWQAPKVPAVDRSSVISATTFGASCPQTPRNEGVPDLEVDALYYTYGSEDCLFLNVYAPQKATSLPVLFWIHGGGYGASNGQTDMTSLINNNDNGFVVVSIQYRLGAFGFLSSKDVANKGVVNAGLLDQHLALQWVQKYIHLFGGNPANVTIAGESAGAGSVMLHAMAYGGTIGQSLFNNLIVASPYLPKQYSYDDDTPTSTYYAFAEAAGCTKKSKMFECLVNTDSQTLQIASGNVSQSIGPYGSWSFVPVTDGIYVTERPTQQLVSKKLNGLRLLSGNNANEAPIFVPQNITTEATLTTYVQDLFPDMSKKQVAAIIAQYPGSKSPDSPNAVKFATLGYTGPTAVTQSSIATGHQQRANDIYAETTFVCPSYWLADSFSGNGRNSYKYQYSVLPATHGTDLTGEFGPAAIYQSEAFVEQFQRIWGSFVITGDPTMSNASSSDSAVTDWPVWNPSKPTLLNMNQTGGEIVNETLSILLQSYGQDLYTEFYAGDGLTPDFSLADAHAWEGGRGARCNFWKSIAKTVPE